MHQDAEVTASSPAVAAAEINLEELSRNLGREGRWDELVTTLIERSTSGSDLAERISCLKRASSIYETKLRDIDKAFITLQAALAEDYKNADVVRELERVAALTGRPRILIEDYQAMVDTVADSGQQVALLLLLASWHQQRDEVSGAEEKLRRALAVDPTSMIAVRRLTDLLTKREDWPRLAEHLARSGGLVLRPSDNADLLLAAAEVYHRKLKRLPDATGLYTRVLELDPGSVTALEGLVEITWQEENWVRALPLLEQMAMAENIASADRSHICQRAAMAAIRTGDFDRARAHARKVLELDVKESEAFLRDWIDIAYSRQWWQDVRELGEWVLARMGLRLTGAERAELHVRIGRAHVEAGHDAEARDELAKAVKLDPGNRRCRELLVDIYSRLNRPEAALEHQKAIIEKVTSPDEKWRLLVEVARTERDAVRDPHGALAAFKKALALKPHDRSILSDMVELHSELRQWRPATELLLRLAESEDAGGRAPYLVAAANILHYELRATEEAIALYERALDEDPADLKTFERLDRILTAKRAWREKARAYRRMITRIGPANDETKRVSLLGLWRGLAELFRTELTDLPSAAAALEVCVKLEPSSLVEQEALAELYEATGPEGLRAAVDRRSYLFERQDDPEVMIRQLKALRNIYMHAGLADRSLLRLRRTHGDAGRRSGERRLLRKSGWPGSSGSPRRLERRDLAKGHLSRLAGSTVVLAVLLRRSRHCVDPCSGRPDFPTQGPLPTGGEDGPIRGSSAVRPGRQRAERSQARGLLQCGIRPGCGDPESPRPDRHLAHDRGWARPARGTSRARHRLRGRSHPGADATGSPASVSQRAPVSRRADSHRSCRLQAQPARCSGSESGCLPPLPLPVRAHVAAASPRAAQLARPLVDRKLAHPRPRGVARRRRAHRQPRRIAVLWRPRRGGPGTARHPGRGGRPRGAGPHALERLGRTPRAARAPRHRRQRCRGPGKRVALDRDVASRLSRSR